MKLSLKSILVGMLIYTASTLSVLAAGLDHFEVTLSPSTSKVGEALDLTIEAVDKNNSVVTDYEGTVLIFSESDPEANLPIALEDNTYTFVGSDQGKVTFENSVTFGKEGNQNIHVYDFNDDTVYGIAEVEITKNEELENIEIDIISPENGLTIGESNIKVSGNSKKNHQIIVTVNDSEEIKTTTNEDGIFEVNVEKLENGENTFIAEVLNGDGEKVGKSDEVKIKVESDNLSIKNVKTIPEEVDSEGAYEIEVIANNGLSEVNVVVNDVITALEETEAGVYKAKVYAPKIAETYAIDVELKDEIGHIKKELGAASIKVNAVELYAPKEEKEEPKDDLNAAIDETPDLRIKGLKLVELKTRSILTWEEVKEAESYNIYKRLENDELELVDNVTETKFEVAITGDEVKYDFFAVKALAKTASGEIFEGDLSEATKIKTGPEFFILLLLSLFIGLGFVVLKQRRA